MKKSTFVSFAMVGAVASGSMAGLTTYGDRVNFLSTLSGEIIHDDYETYELDMANGARTLGFDGYSVTYDGGNQFGIDNLSSSSRGVSATSGSQYLRVDFGSGSARSITIVFDGLVSDFGIMIRDLENTGLSYVTDSGLSGGAFGTTGNNGVAFFGITTDGEESLAFSSITFTMVGTGGGVDGVVFDQLTYTNSTVPAPGAMALLGLGGLAMGRRRR